MLYMKTPNRVVSPLVAARVLPLWLEIEADYANRKFGDANPQNHALVGGLVNRSDMAYQEISNYHSRFWYYQALADGNKDLHLKASQPLGKLVSTNRALLRVCLQLGEGLTRGEADNLTFDLLGDMILSHVHPVSGALDASRKKHNQENVINPMVSNIDAYISAGQYDHAAETALGLVIANAQLWIDFTSATGVIAIPGMNGSDPESTRYEWRIDAGFN